YKLPDVISGYPTLQDRKILSRRSAEKLTQLVDLFEMANYLHAIGRYEDAIQYFAFVLQQYPSRELYNNLGVTALMSAVDLFSAEEMKFKFFAELDLQSSASRGATDSIQRTKYLQQAILHFDAAISLDPAYAPAYFNKAVAYALLKDIPRARFYAGVEAMNKSQNGTFDKTAKDIRILLAILDAMEGREQKARDELATLADQGQLMAIINLDILNGKPLSASKNHKISKPANSGPDNLVMEQIVKALETGDELPVDTIITNRLTQHLNYHQSESKSSGMKLKISENSASNRSIVFLTVQHDHAPDPIQKIGADRQNILDAYGPAQHIVETPNGQLLVYKSGDREAAFSGRILVFDAHAKLSRTIQFKEILN
ncbi:MAG TPA: tetratricopeptide repeat protein, partial [Saprospiraceae bacterium]|nr:tetratricopeptide repeat protein [Saprospiraceae bacterium]